MPPINTMMPAHAQHAHAPVKSGLDSLARKILLCLLAILPFFFFPVAWMTSLQSKIVVASVLLIVVAVIWIVARVKEGGGTMPRNMIFGAAALLPVVYALSAAVNGFGSVSLVGTGVEADTLAIICVEFAALALSAMLLNSERSLVSSLRALFAGILVLEVIHVLHVLFPSLSLGGVLAGKTGNAMGTWHEFTMLMGLALVASLALCRSIVTEGMWKWVVYAAGVIAVPVLIVSNFADVWIAVFVSAIVLVALQWRQNRAALNMSLVKNQWVTLLVALIAIICAIFGANIVSRLPERLSVVQVEVRPSWAGTFQIGTQSLSGAKAFIFGVGPNTFTRQWGLYKPLAVNQTPFWNADFNVGVAPIPTAFISLGILGALAWLLFVIAVLWSVIMLWVRRTEMPLSGPMTALSLATVYLLAFHLSSVPGTSLGLLMFIVIGLYVATAARTDGSLRSFSVRGTGSHNLAKVAVAALIVVLAVVAGIGDLRAVFADALINKAIVAYNQSQDLQKSTDLIQMSLKVQPSNDRAHRSAVELGLLKLQQLIASKDPNQDAARTQLQTTLEDTIKHGLTAVQIDSRDYQNWLQLASLYSQLAGAQIQGAYDNARAAYVRAQQENPTSPLPLLNLGQLDALEGNYPAALENLGKAVQLKPDLASAYYLASQVYVAQQDAPNALTAAALAARYAPNDPLAWYNAGAIAYAAGDYRDAGIAMQQALALQPQYANAMYILGLSLYQLNDPQDALVVFNALNQLDPNQPVVQQIITNLQAGKRIDAAPGSAPTVTTPAKTTPKK